MNFSEAYKTHFREIFLYLYRRVGNTTDCEDIAAEVFASAWKVWDSFDQSQPLRNWLYGIASHKLNDFLRKKYNLQAKESGQAVEDLGADDEPEAVAEVESTAEEPEFSNGILSSIRQLNPKEQKLLELKYVNGMSNPNMAAELDMTVNNVKVTHNRIIKKLHSIWQKK